MVKMIKKGVLILSVKIQVNKKEKQILDNKPNERKIYTKSLKNNKNTINLLGKLEFFLVPITGRHIDVETLYQVADVCVKPNIAGEFSLSLI